MSPGTDAGNTDVVAIMPPLCQVRIAEDGVPVVPTNYLDLRQPFSPR